MAIRVIRVGGSLLTWQPFVAQFEIWLEAQAPAVNVLIAGGGPWVELLRQSAQRFEIPEAEAHVLCLRAMSVTAELLGQLCGGTVVRSLDSIQNEDQKSSRLVLDVYHQLEEVDTFRGDALPRTWAVTSDSIAARIATDLRADELVILKSSDPPPGIADHSELGELGYVDPYFATAVGDMPVRIINLRRFD